MNLHFLPGDAVVEEFRKTGIEGEVAVCRECLIEGPAAAGNLDEFWETRREFFDVANDDSNLSYDRDVRPEFEKLFDLQAGSELNLWFEYELFCQANLWFTLSLLEDSAATIYRIAPVVRTALEKWKGFGRLDAKELQECFEARVKLDRDEIGRGVRLWEAYCLNNEAALRELAVDSPGLPMLSEIVPVAIDIEEGPKSVLSRIIDDGITGPEKIFVEFSKRAGVYGYGDTQVYRLLESMHP